MLGKREQDPAESRDDSIRFAERATFWQFFRIAAPFDTRNSHRKKSFISCRRQELTAEREIRSCSKSTP